MTPVSTLPRGLRRRFADGRGGAAVEFALVLPFLFLVIYGIIEVGFLLWDVAVLDFAVEQAARCAVVNSAGVCNTQSGIQQVAWGWGGLAIGVNIQQSSFQIQSPCPGATGGTQVAVPYTFTTGAPMLDLSLVARSCYPS